MNIRQADPQQLKQLAVFFENSSYSQDTGQLTECFLRKLSYCLARGSCFVSDSSQLQGAIVLDTDLLGLDRVVAVHASEGDKLKDLLKFAVANSSSSQLFLTINSNDSSLSAAANDSGFTPCGDLTLPYEKGQINFFSAKIAH